MNYNIPKYLLPQIEKRMAKLSRSARKTSSEEISFKVLREYSFRPPKEYFSIEMVEVELLGSSPKFQGWSFIGVIRHTQAGNLLCNFPDQVLSESYRDSKPYCDHCQKVRTRSNTFVVRHQDGKEYRVGKSCLKDFLGHRDPHKILKIAEYMVELTEAEAEQDEDSFRQSRVKPRFKIEEILLLALRDFKKRGYVSKKAEKMASTSEVVMMAMAKESQIAPPTEEESQESAKIIEFMKSDVNGANSWRLNLQVAYKNEWVTFKDISLVCSGLVAWCNHLGREAYQKHERETSNWIGQIGDRIDLELTVTSIREIDTQYGMSFYINFKDQAGNKFFWKTNRELSMEMKYKIKATVKKHDEYKGIKCTAITRGKILEAVNV